MESSREPLLGNSESFGNLLVAVADAIGLGVWDYVPDTNKIYWSDQARKLYGIPHAENWDCPRFLSCVHPLDRQRLIDATTASLDPELQAPFNIEYRILSADGKTRWVMAKGRALFDPAEVRATEMFGISLDVTRHKHTERRLEAIVTSANDAVITVDVDGRIVDWSPAATKIYGYSSGEMLGRTIETMVPPEQLEESLKIYERARRGETVSSVQTERIRKGGKRIQILLTLSPVFDAAGGVIGVSKVSKDITEQLAAEEQLRQVQRMESIGLLAGGIAHDFNNLLTVINGYASRLLTQVPDSDEIRRQLLYIEEAGTRAQALTSQLLAFSRKQILQPRVVSLRSVIENLAPLLTRLIREDVEISTIFEATEDRVEIDQNQLEQVLLNLVVNASDAMPQGGKLSIETSPIVITETGARLQLGLAEGSYVVLAVSDTGTGISAEVLPQIFDPFFTTKPTGKGTGLGLASVHGIVKQSGGHVVAYSEVGMGTTIRVYLPASERELDEEVVQSGLQQAPVAGSHTILVVEDDALLRQYATEVLSDLGYTIIQASNGVAALDIAQNVSAIDLLITDVVMPAMSGKQLAETLTQARPKLRVLYISGYTENTIAQNRILHPGVQYLAKPFTPDQLHRKVQDILAKTGETKTVLIVDDDPNVRRTIGSLLGESGYEVIEADNGLSAIDLCTREAADLILLDIVMPEQEGIETLRQIKRANPKCPIIAMSGYPTYLAPARALGSAATFSKPLAMGSLIQSIRGLIG